MAIRNDNTFASAPKTGDGEIHGVTSTDKIGFFGSVPVVRAVLPTGATTAQIAAELARLGLTTLT